MGKKTDEAAVAQHKATLEQKLDAYEVVLSKHAYLAGETLTIADLAHIPHAWIMVNDMKLDVLTSEKRPNVARCVCFIVCWTVSVR